MSFAAAPVQQNELPGLDVGAWPGLWDVFSLANARLQVRLGDYVEVHAAEDDESINGEDYHYIYRVQEFWQNRKVCM